MPAAADALHIPRMKSVKLAFALSIVLAGVL